MEKRPKQLVEFNALNIDDKIIIKGQIKTINWKTKIKYVEYNALNIDAFIINSYL